MVSFCSSIVTYVVGHIYKKSPLKHPTTAFWLFMIFSFSYNIISLENLLPVFVMKGFIVDQKSLDLGPPMHIS